LVISRIVFFDVLELRPDPKFIQGVLEKGDIPADAVDAQPSHRMEDDPVAGGSQIIFLVEIGGLVDIGVSLISGLAEIEDRLPEFGHLGPVAFEKVEPEQDGFDPDISLGLADVHPEFVHGQGPDSQDDVLEEVGRGDLLKLAGQVDLQISVEGDSHGRPSPIHQEI
jgi:hypothetical protein